MSPQHPEPAAPGRSAELSREDSGFVITARWHSDAGTDITGPDEVVIRLADDAAPEVRQQGVTSAVLHRLGRQVDDMVAEAHLLPSVGAYQVMVRRYIEGRLVELAQARGATADGFEADLLTVLEDVAGRGHVDPFGALASATGRSRAELNELLDVARRQQDHTLAPRRDGSPTGADTSHVTTTEPRRAWSDVFHRSRVSPQVFVVAEAAEQEVEQVVAALGLPEATSVKLFDNAHWATPLLDGAVVKLRAYGLPTLPSGTRVYGHRPLRLLCHLMDLQPPARALAGEPSVPETAELLAELDRQRKGDTDALLAQARTAMANDSQEVRAAVEALFGDQAVAGPA